MAGLVATPHSAYRSSCMKQLRATFSVQAFEATAYVALSAVLGVISFIVLVPTLALGVPLLVVALAGLPLIAFAFALCHLLATVERRRVARGVRDRVPDPPAPARRQPRRAARCAGSARAAPGWSSATRSIALPFVGWVGGLLVFFAWGAALGAADASRCGRCSPTGRGCSSAPTSATSRRAAIHFAAGAGALYAAPWLARGVAAVQVAMARLLLEPGERERLIGRVDTLEETRAGMVAAADAERRRIERDLHDGAQQRLVALAMTLGRAKATEDPALARTLRRRGARRGQGGARRAAQPRARHPPRGADRPRAGRRRLRARRALPDPGRGRRRPPAPRRARRARRSPTSSSPRR